MGENLGQLERFKTRWQLPKILRLPIPLEVWAGIDFGLVAFLLQMGMEKQGWQITEAVVRQIHENDLQFHTPEAITSVET
ncbi:MAG UNVERIFIED_CONTAM: hypothetical protein LVR29_17445 [Microcystis novacekii LVE1205-3]|jgi:uncharacterized protein (DUF608 family)